MQLKKLLVLVSGVALSLAVAMVDAKPPAAQEPAPKTPSTQAPADSPGGRGGRGSRFKIYPKEQVDQGLPLYNSTCGYCHGDRGKGGQAGPDLIASRITLHDEDGVQIAEYLHGAAHAKLAKIEATDTEIGDIAAYLHSRVVYASGRGDVHMSEVLVGDAKAGEQYFNGAGGCAKCHSPTGDLKGVGGKYDAATLQEKLVMPRTGRGGFGRGGGSAAPPPNSPTATVTLPSGQTFKGTTVVVTDFYVTLRLEDGSTQTWARNHGIPKVTVTDPLQAHIDIMRTLSDTNMHNLTAYLATLK